MQEVSALPSTSTTPPELDRDRYAGLDEGSKGHGYTQQDSQSDCEVVVVPENKPDDTQAPALK